MAVDDVISKGSFVSHFECFLCDRLHEVLRGKEKPSKSNDKKVTHYGCPKPSPIFENIGNKTQPTAEEGSPSKMWQDAYWIAKYEAKAMRKLMKSQTEFSQDQLMDVAMELYSLDHRPDELEES